MPQMEMATVVPKMAIPRGREGDALLLECYKGIKVPFYTYFQIFAFHAGIH